jgi:cardiolipin synthase
MYIFALDELGNEIISLLCEASQRGVKVRLLVDGIGSPSFNSHFIKNFFENYKVEIRVYKPISSWFFNSIISLFSMNWNEVRLYFISMNHRDHHKTAIFDNKLIMIGSANISQAHSHWREVMIEVSGDNILYIIDKFNEVWSKSSNFQNYNKKSYHRMNIVYKDKVSRVDLINNAKSFIKMVNPYFIPPYYLLVPLIRAARRGVKVEFMISKKCDIILMSWFYRQYYQFYFSINK